MNRKKMFPQIVQECSIAVPPEHVVPLEKLDYFMKRLGTQFQMNNVSILTKVRTLADVM